MDLFDRLRICWLYTDFKLYQSRAHLFQKFQFFFIQNIRGNLKVEVRNAIIMLHDIFPDSNAVVVFAVECTVNKFHLRYFVVKEKLQLLLHQFYIPETQTLVHRWQTIAAGERASSACLVVNDLVFKIFHMIVDKWDFAQIHDRTPRIVDNFLFFFPESDSVHTL